MNTRLSSGSTFFFKFILPAFFVAAAGLNVIGFMLDWVTGGALVVWQGFLLLVLGLIVWRCSPLKRVRLDGDALLISDYRREIRVPLKEVAAIEEPLWRRDRRVTLRFRSGTTFGDYVEFIPRGIFFLPWRASCVADELRAAL